MPDTQTPVLADMPISPLNLSALRTCAVCSRVVPPEQILFYLPPEIGGCVCRTHRVEAYTALRGNNTSLPIAFVHDERGQNPVWRRASIGHTTQAWTFDQRGRRTIVRVDRRHAETCQMCHDTCVSAHMLESDGARICPRCEGRMNRTCEDCGVRFRSTRETDRCPACSKYELHHHSWKPTPIMFGEPGEGWPRFGFEIETDPDHDCDDDSDDCDSDSEPVCIRSALDCFADQYMHAEEDGSLGTHGIEFVTMPASLRWMAENREAFKSFFRLLPDNAGGAGLHIHASRTPLVNSAMRRAIPGFYGDDALADAAFRISRRGRGSFNEWCRLTNQPSYPGDGGRTENRYTYFNCTRNTVECRGFSAAYRLKHLDVSILWYVGIISAFAAPSQPLPTVRHIVESGDAVLRANGWKDSVVDDAVSYAETLLGSLFAPVPVPVIAGSRTGTVPVPAVATF